MVKSKSIHCEDEIRVEVCYQDSSSWCGHHRAYSGQVHRHQSVMDLFTMIFMDGESLLQRTVHIIVVVCEIAVDLSLSCPILHDSRQGA